MEMRKKIVVCLLSLVVLLIIINLHDVKNKSVVKFETNQPIKTDGKLNQLGSDSADFDTQKLDAPTPALNFHDIVFYGKVLDQHNEPVSHAKVIYTPPPYPNPGLTPNWETKTDENGTFKIEVKDIPSLSISIIPPSGYYKNPYLTGVRYNFSPDGDRATTYIPSPNQPELFKVEKMIETEPMIHREFADKMLKNQNFILGDNSQSVDVEYSVDPVLKRITSNTSTEVYNWSVKIRVKGGGLKEQIDPENHVTPIDGYIEEMNITYSEDMPDKVYRKNIKKNYFFRTSDQCYGRISIDLIADPKNSFIILESWLNPLSGSKATEFDASKEME